MSPLKTIKVIYNHKEWSKTVLPCTIIVPGYNIWRVLDAATIHVPGSTGCHAGREALDGATVLLPGLKVRHAGRGRKSLILSLVY